MRKALPGRPLGVLPEGDPGLRAVRGTKGSGAKREWNRAGGLLPKGGGSVL